MKHITFIFLLALLCCLPASAQGLTLLFESEPGTRPAGLFSDGFESGDTSSLLDANGDGTPDLIMTRDDADGCLQALRVVDVASGNTLWEVQDVPQMLVIYGQCWIFSGFADPDADGEPEALFVSDQDVVLINPSDNSLAWAYSDFIPSDFPVLLRAVTDLTGDGYPELIISLPETQQVQVWSRMP